MQPGALACAAFEGSFVLANPQFQLSNPPYPTAPAGSGAFVSAPPGVIQGRFGWADPSTGLCANQPAAGAWLGIVGIIEGWRRTWGRVWFDPTVCATRIREGLPVTLYTGGPFWLRFVNGAYAGAQVYADNVDGHAISGNTGGSITKTLWTVSTSCAPGGLSIVSSTAFYGA